MLVRRSTSAAAPSPRTLHLAWWSALLLTAVLVAGLALARTALATAPPAPLGSESALALLAGEEEECEADEPDCEEEFECEEWEEGEEEAECEEEADGKNKGQGEGGQAPAECLLTSARPRVSVAAGRRKVRLDVRYDLSAPAEVSVSLRSSGGRGAIAIPTRRLRLSHDGSFHDTAALSEAETERALAAKQFTVRLRVLGVPWSCHRYDFRHLAVRRGGNEAPVFSESGADLRAGR